MASMNGLLTFQWFSFLKNKLEDIGLFVGPLIPLFWIKKSGWIPLLMCNRILRFTSGSTPADLLVASLAAVFIHVLANKHWWDSFLDDLLYVVTEIIKA